MGTMIRIDKIHLKEWRNKRTGYVHQAKDVYAVCWAIDNDNVEYPQGYTFTPYLGLPYYSTIEEAQKAVDKKLAHNPHLFQMSMLVADRKKEDN